MFRIEQVDSYIKIFLSLYTRRAMNAVNCFMDRLNETLSQDMKSLFFTSSFSGWCGVCGDGELILATDNGFGRDRAFVNAVKLFKCALDELKKSSCTEVEEDAKVLLKGFLSSRRPTKKFKEIAGTPFDPFIQTKLELLFNNASKTYDFKKLIDFENAVNSVIEEGWRMQEY